MTLSGRYVAVVGPADAARPADLAHAEEVGRLLAEADAVPLTGGHHGVMQAAARGARDGGGVSIGLGELRHGLLVRAAHAVVADSADAVATVHTLLATR